MRRQPPPDPFWSHTTTQPRHHAAGSRWLCWRVLGPSQTPRLTGSPVARPRATTAPGGRRGGGGKTLPAWTPGQAYASQSGAGRILGSGEQGDSRETSPRVTRGPQTAAPAWEPELGPPCQSAQEREAAGGRGKAREQGSTPGQTPPRPREGKGYGQSSPLSDRAPDSAPSGPPSQFGPGPTPR